MNRFKYALLGLLAWALDGLLFAARKLAQFARFLIILSFLVGAVLALGRILFLLCISIGMRDAPAGFFYFEDSIGYDVYCVVSFVVTALYLLGPQLPSYQYLVARGEALANRPKPQHKRYDRDGYRR